ncbi:MAG: UDP-N-acetylmuramoyl-tripeptide--D-alanyl-D-alanine ligase [Deltaproteobacteria bacterium]|nr:UDP-N-acetylmuramoyl-tripeptide--D-alanyl-D-alanine ligase [Deltaproteobacteria bacterium]
MTGGSEHQWTLDWALEATRGVLVGVKDLRRFSGICTDSRNLRAGELFLALKGDRFDGHDFITQVIEAGAAGVVAARERWEASDGSLPSVPVIMVEDTLTALGDLAAFWRRLHPVPLVAITGSNGKTTTKEMVAAIMARHCPILKNQANLNNLVGLPLTLLELARGHEAAVVEMGMNHPGEIARLTQIAAPDVGLITNIQPAHLEGLGSIEGIQAAKGELFSGLSSRATIVVNRDDSRVAQLANSFRGRQVGFSTVDPAADVTLTRILGMDHESTRFILRLGDGTREIRIHVAGRHHLANAVAAAAVAWALKIDPIDIAEGLASFRPFDKRMEILALAGRAHLINDTYNANPGSMTAALQTLRVLKAGGRAVAVLGDMLELGERSSELHREVGRVAAREGVDYLLAMGKQAHHLLGGATEGGMPSERLIQGSDHGEIARKVQALITPGAWVLVKGSRGMRMEKVVEALLQAVKDTG